MKAKEARSGLSKFCNILWVIATCMALLAGARYYRYYKCAKDNNNIVVYDLTWTDKTVDGPEVLRKWRYFIETKTNLPRKIEKYSKCNPDNEYTLEETLVIEYPAEDEIRQVIKDANF